MNSICRKGFVILAMLVVCPGFSSPVVAGPENPSELGSGDEPDHLVPVNPGPPPNADLEKLGTVLNLDQFCFAGMSSLIEDGNDFRGSCLRLHAWNGGREIGKVDQFMLTYSDAWIRDSRLWFSRTTTVPLPVETARCVCALWDKMMLSTRPTLIRSTIFDGVTTVFRTPGRSGSCYQPEKFQSPRLLKKLGSLLVDYCQATPENRERILDKIGKKAVELHKYLESHPQEGP